MISALSWFKKTRKQTVTYNRSKEKITRAQFLGKVGAVVAAAPFVTLMFGMAKGRYNFYLKKVNLKFSSLPNAFNGLKIIQISDVHLGNYNK